MSIKEFLQQDVDLERFYDELYQELDNLSHLELHEKIPKNVPDRKDRLKGLPFSFKDAICTKGFNTRAGSKVLEGYKPPFDATVVKKVKENNGGVIAKTHQDEFGLGSFSVTCAYAKPRNPWNPERCCGGSSGGSGGLTAALDFPHISLGESTGGSISNPASFCGVVGLTPTYGTVSRYGLLTYGNSLDKIGPMSRSVYGATLGLEIISGNDPMDPTTTETDTDYLDALDRSIEGRTIGLPKEYFEHSDPEVSKTVKDAVKQLEDLGAEIKYVQLPKTEYALPAYLITAFSEVSTNLAKFCGMRYGLEDDLDGKDFNEYFSEIRSKGFGDKAKLRIMLGTFARMAGHRNKYYLKAMKVRRKVINDFRSSLKEVDVIAAPAMPIVAPKFNKIDDLSVVEINQLDILSVPANFAGLPQLTMTCGFKDDMPIGLKLFADHFEEKNILNVAESYERKRGKLNYPEVNKQ